MKHFGDRTGAALVVGGSGGLGLAITRMLASRGCDVAVTFRTRPEAGAATVASAREWGGHASSYALDLAAPTAAADAADVIDAVLAAYGGLHTLVYAAGPQVPMTHLSEVEPGAMAAQLAADAAGFFAVVRPALPALREAQGSVVAVTTAATTRFPVRDGLSAAPKAAVEAIVRALAVEEGRYGVRVNAVGPGMLTDGMAARLISSGELSEEALAVTRRNIPLRRFGTATDVAEAVCFLASDRAGFVSGQEAGRRWWLGRLSSGPAGSPGRACREKPDRHAERPRRVGRVSPADRGNPTCRSPVPGAVGRQRVGVVPDHVDRAA